jgi:hypothetical protein
LYFFHLFPYLSLGHRKCEPPVIGVEMNLAIKFADGLVIRHPPIGIASESASDRTCGDGHLGMAFHKMANALVKWIRTNSLQQLHDQAAAVIEQRRSATTSSTDDEAGRNQLIRLAQQPLQGGFA